MNTLNYNFDAHKLSADITNLLNLETINQLAIDTGFVVRAGGKLSGFEFLDMLLFTHFNQKELSLNDLSIQLSKRYGIKICPQSIDERFTDRSINFFKAILQKAINISIKPELEINLTDFNKVRIKDSTSFQLPENMKEKYSGSGGSASPSAIRIQFEYDLKNYEILDLSLHPFTTQDMRNAEENIDNINANELVMRDLGYVKIKNLQIIDENLAFYLNRLHSGTKVYKIIKGEFSEIDFGKMHKRMKAYNIKRIDKEVYVGSKEKFKTRMIIELLPDEIYKERLRNAKKNAKKNKTNISNSYKARIGLNIFVTNTKIQGKHLRLLYTLRWQIELMFKIWKSIGEIDKIKKMKVERFETCLFAKLIWVVINWQITRNIIIYYFSKHDIEISPYKLFKTLKSEIPDLREAVLTGQTEVIAFIDSIVALGPNNLRSEKKNRTTTWSYEIFRLL